MVTLKKTEAGSAIPAVHLTLQAKVPRADQATFRPLADKAKADCPVSKLCKADISWMRYCSPHACGTPPVPRPLTPDHRRS
jgi:organic hydroperoxide reductase OsmC/OhrA